jgi:hypothetical protein
MQNGGRMTREKLITSSFYYSAAGIILAMGVGAADGGANIRVHAVDWSRLMRG